MVTPRIYWYPLGKLVPPRKNWYPLGFSGNPSKISGIPSQNWYPLGKMASHRKIGTPSPTSPSTGTPFPPFLLPHTPFQSTSLSSPPPNILMVVLAWLVNIAVIDATIQSQWPSSHLLSWLIVIYIVLALPSSYSLALPQHSKYTYTTHSACAQWSSFEKNENSVFHFTNSSWSIKFIYHSINFLKINSLFSLSPPSPPPLPTLFLPSQLHENIQAW